jgi:hypothetical protein
MVDESFFGLETALNFIPHHCGVVLGGDTVLGVPGEPFEALLDLGLGQQKLS